MKIRKCNKIVIALVLTVLLSCLHAISPGYASMLYTGVDAVPQMRYNYLLDYTVNFGIVNGICSSTASCSYEGQYTRHVLYTCVEKVGSNGWAVIPGGLNTDSGTGGYGVIAEDMYTIGTGYYRQYSYCRIYIGDLLVDEQTDYSDVLEYREY